MATLLEVFTQFFRPHGYYARLGVDLTGASGRTHHLPALLERDGRRLVLDVWTDRTPLDPQRVAALSDACKDLSLDGGLLASLGPFNESAQTTAAAVRLQLWDARRTAQELGGALLRETCPEAWDLVDPLVAARPSRMLDQIQQQNPRAAAAAPAPPPPATMDPVLEPAFPAAIAPLLATPEAAPTPSLELPFAFGILDAPAAPAAPAAPTPVPMAVQVQLAAPVFAPEPARPARKLLRVLVNKNLAVSLARPKTKTADRLFLRLVPFHIFDYEANILVEGSLQGERKTGRMAVDAALKRIVPWTNPLDLSDLPHEGVDVDEKPIRIGSDDASKLLVKELKTMVTRDVVMAEDASEWSVTVKKKVTLGDEELRLNYLGCYWQPVWRVSGKEGSVEIDGATGELMFSESLVPTSDSQLI